MGVTVASINTGEWNFLGAVVAAVVAAMISTVALVWSAVSKNRRLHVAQLEASLELARDVRVARVEEAVTSLQRTVDRIEVLHRAET